MCYLNDQTCDLILIQGLYRNWKTELQDFSRIIPGLFSIFKDSISSQFCIKQRKNALFFSQKYPNEALDFFDSDTGYKNRDYRTNWIEYEFE